MTRGNSQQAGFGKNGRSRWPSFLLLLLLNLLFWQDNPTTLQAQSQTPAYWRHSASSRISHVINQDMNQDGVDEFLVAAENGRIEFLNAIGNLQWSIPTGDVIQAMNILDLDDDPELEIALVANRNLTVLSMGGTELWSIPLNTISPPQELLAFSSTTGGQEWLARYNVQVSQLEPFDHDGDGREELLVLFSSGQLQLYDQEGQIIWSDDKNSSPLLSTQVIMQVADLNGDGQEEVALGYFDPSLRFSVLRLIDGNQQDIWEQAQPISDVISALTVVPFGEAGELFLAVGSGGGQINLLNYDRQREWWPRTLNKPITTLKTGEFNGEPLLFAGTEVGVVVAYRANGSRLWTRRLVPDANRPVVGLSTAKTSNEETDPLLAVLLGPETGTDGPTAFIVRP